MALRASLKAKSKAAKEKGKLYVFVVCKMFMCMCIVAAIMFYLVYWEHEEQVSIHPESEIVTETKAIGELCQVRFGKLLYEGKIACIGKWILFVRKL